VREVRAKGVGDISEWKAWSSAQRSKLGRPVSLMMLDIGAEATSWSKIWPRAKVTIFAQTVYSFARDVAVFLFSIDLDGPRW